MPENKNNPLFKNDLTRVSLFENKLTLKNLTTGVDILGQKVTALQQAVSPLIKDSTEYAKKENDLFRRAYDALRVARLRSGEAKIESTGLAVKPIEVEIKQRRVMGISVPKVKVLTAKQNLPPYAPGETSVSIDEARVAFQDLIEHLPDMVRNIAVLRLRSEIKKTSRRKNGIKEILVPQLEMLIRKIQEALDLVSMEEFAKQKLIKKKIRLKKKQFSDE
ncbi:MAG TPA: V-type ATP synthase subunit D [Patescibacteria group bacterium]